MDSQCLWLRKKLGWLRWTPSSPSRSKLRRYSPHAYSLMGRWRCYPSHCLQQCDLLSSAWTQVQDVQAPAQVKKSKKKNKTDAKPVQHVVTDDWKEPDDGMSQATVREIHHRLLSFRWRSWVSHLPYLQQSAQRPDHLICFYLRSNRCMGDQSQ